MLAVSKDIDQNQQSEFVIVEGLCEKISEKDILNHFNLYGHIKYVNIVRDSFLHLKNGYAIIHMDDSISGWNASRNKIQCIKHHTFTVRLGKPNAKDNIDDVSWIIPFSHRSHREEPCFLERNEGFKPASLCFYCKRRNRLLQLKKKSSTQNKNNTEYPTHYLKNNDKIYEYDKNINENRERSDDSDFYEKNLSNTMHSYNTQQNKIHPDPHDSRQFDRLQHLNNAIIHSETDDFSISQIDLIYEDGMLPNFQNDFQHNFYTSSPKEQINPDSENNRSITAPRFDF